MPKSKRIFKNRIKQYMDDHRMDNDYVLENVGVSRNTFFRLKRNGQSRLDADTAYEFAALFGVPFERLFYIDEV